MIYALKILDQKFVKIGFTESCVQRRIAELQTGNPFEISELFNVPGNLLQEQKMHALLKDAFRITRIPIPPNEWYPGKHPFFRGFLDALQAGADQGVVYLRLKIGDRQEKQPSPRHAEAAEFLQSRQFGRIREEKDFPEIQRAWQTLQKYGFANAPKGFRFDPSIQQSES